MYNMYFAVREKFTLRQYFVGLTSMRNISRFYTSPPCNCCFTVCKSGPPLLGFPFYRSRRLKSRGRVRADQNGTFSPGRKYSWNRRAELSRRSRRRSLHSKPAKERVPVLGDLREPFRLLFQWLRMIEILSQLLLGVLYQLMYAEQNDWVAACSWKRDHVLPVWANYSVFSN